MINQILFSLLTMSIPAKADVIKYNTALCNPAIASKYQVFVQGSVKLSDNYGESTFDIDAFMNTFMMPFLKQMEGSLVAAKDLSVIMNLEPLCAGAYHDSQGANAMAIGAHNIFFGLNLIHDLQADWKVDAEIGMKVILAHEYAHIIQNRLAVPFNFPLKLWATKAKELQADCIAGTLMTFHSSKSGILTESDKLMKMLGDLHMVGDHGVYEERRKAIFFGMQKALEFMMKKKTANMITSRDMLNACSEKYPPIP